MKKYALLALLASLTASATLVIPYTFAPGPTIQSSQVNANFSAIASNVNALESATNPFNTTLAQVLSVNNSCGSSPIDFNGQQALDFIAENLASDPAPGNKGRLFVNSSTNLLKFDDGSTIQTVGGSGSNNLSSVLNSGNSAGAFNIDLNENQLLHGRAENLASDPSAGNAGRVYYNTATHALKVDSGSAWSAIGGSQGLASVLGVSNSAGSTDVNFNQNHAVSMALDNLASDPGSPVAGQIWLNTTSHIPKFYNGTSSLAVGNTNTLAQTLALGNSAGSSPIDFNGQQAQHFVLWNNSGSPGTGTPGYTWFDTSNSQIGFETSGSNHYVCSLDQTQTITNHTISGASNTLSNIQDGSLSTNVALLNGVQTISGKKTFSSPPVLGTVLSSSGDTITVPTGTGNDTFVYLNAAQTLGGKTLNAPIITGNTNFSEGQGLSFRAENVGSLPSAGNIGRLVWNIGGQTLAVDNGSSWFSIASNPVITWANVLTNGNSAGSINPDFNFNQALHLELENLGSAPSAGNIGRLYYNTVTLIPQYDNGSSILTLADTSSTQTLTNKTLVPANNTLSLASGHILVGSAGGAATDVAMSGGVSITNTGATTVVTNANLTGPITSVGNATSIASQTGTGTKFVVDTSPTIAGTLSTATQTETGAYTNSFAGIASTPAMFFSGSPFAAGTGTTSRPAFLMEDAATPSTTWNVLGTYVGVNALSTFNGDLLNLSKAGTTEFQVGASGSALFRGTMQSAQVTVGPAGVLTTGNNVTLILGSTRTFSTADQVQLAISTNNGSTGTHAAASILPTYNQTSTAGGTDLLINRTETAIGSGTQKLIDAQVGGTTKFNVDRTGNIVAAGTTLTIGSITAVTPTSGACFGTGGVLGTCTAGTGTVTSVQVAGANGLTFSGGPVTSSGTITAALTAPTVQTFTSTGTTTGWIFTVTGGTWGNGSQWDDGHGNSYTAIRAGTGAFPFVFCSGSATPIGTTLTKDSGTGSSSLAFTATQALATYTKPTSPAPLYIRIKEVGSGGGGGGSGTGSPGTGATGQLSDFGSGVLVANGGAGGVGGAGAGGLGGTSIVNSGPIGTGVNGASGSAGGASATAGVSPAGGVGGSTPWSGGGAGGAPNTAGVAGNFGSGGGGGGGNGNASGAGGGAGAFIDTIITSPSSTYFYSVGTAGSAGTSGTSGQAGAAGGGGYIEVTEYYQ